METLFKMYFDLLRSLNLIIFIILQIFLFLNLEKKVNFYLILYQDNIKKIINKILKIKFNIKKHLFQSLQIYLELFNFLD